MLISFLTSFVVVLFLVLPERLPDPKKKKAAAGGLVLLALVLIWTGAVMQASEIAGLEKLANQVRYRDLMLQGKKLYQNKKPEEVRKIADQLNAGKQGYGNFLLGVLLIDQGRFDEAEADLQKALTLGVPKEEAPYVWLNLGNVAIKRKDYVLARQRLNQALEIDPDFEPARVNLEAVDAWEGKKIVDKYAWGQA